MTDEEGLGSPLPLPFHLFRICICGREKKLGNRGVFLVGARLFIISQVITYYGFSQGRNSPNGFLCQRELGKGGGGLNNILNSGRL